MSGPVKGRLISDPVKGRLSSKGVAEERCQSLILRPGLPSSHLAPSLRVRAMAFKAHMPVIALWHVLTVPIVLVVFFTDWWPLFEALGWWLL